MAIAHVVVALLLFGHFYVGQMQSIPTTATTMNKESQNASCPILCTCTSWLLSCIGAGKWHQLDNVPFIRGSSYIFNTLELGENDITNVQESNWLPYRWTETLNLSGNVIAKIAGYTFQALPFLETLDLSGNKVAVLLDGTFKSWHGLRFFRQLNLKANPLEVIENDAFDKLPSMQYLDLRGTKLSVQMMYPAFMAVPNIVQLDVPDAVRCCLCYVARTVEILFSTVKIQCSDPCANDTSCDVSETFLMINGTVLRSQMSLKNHKILESFLNQNTDSSGSLNRVNKLSRSSKLGLLHQIEESEKNIYVGNHLDPRVAASRAEKMPHLSRIRPRPSFDRDNRFSSHLGRANHLQLNINGRKDGNHSHLNIFGSDKIPLHQLSHGPRDHHNRGPPRGIVSSKFENKNQKFKTHKVIKRVKRETLDLATNIKEKMKKTTIFNFPETTTPKPEVISELEIDYPEIVELDINAPKAEEPHTLEIMEDPQADISVYEEIDTPTIIEVPPEELNQVENNISKNLNGDSLKDKQKPPLNKALDAGHFSRTIQETEFLDLGNNEAIKVNVSDESWHKPLGQFLDDAVQKNSQPSFDANPVTEPNNKLSQLDIIKLLEDAYNKSPKDGNYSEHPNANTASAQRITKLPALEKKEGNKDLIPPVHPKKIIKESVKSSSSNNTKIKTNVDDMFETKVNEEVRAVEPNKDIQTLFAHVIRIIKIDCLKPKLKAACTDLLTKIGHLMKQYEGKEYLPELGNWNPSLLRPDEKEEAEGKETEMFPPPITRPRERPRQHKGHELGKYVPNYAEARTEQPKKVVSLSAVEYGHKLLLAIAVTVVVMIIIAVVCLIEICSQRSESKAPFASGDVACKKQSKSPLKKVTDRITGKSSSKDAQKAPLLEEDTDLPKPLWLQDLYQPLDSVRKKSMGHGSHYKESSDEEEVFNRANMGAPSGVRTP
uniref:leucine-rich repeat-containing protein 37A-like isoform X2 n=1 Tax=Pristiophorus japonicus TaxID=55135 RepID=UPI00398E5620